MTLEKELKDETEKWLSRAKEKREEIVLVDNTKEDMLKNADAYISDAKHFLEKGDLIRAFEAVTWSWSIMELCLDLGIFDYK